VTLYVIITDNLVIQYTKCTCKSKWRRA